MEKVSSPSGEISPLTRLSPRARGDEKMKFFFLSSHAHRALDPQENRVSGGAELQIALLAKALAARGHDVTIAGGDSGQEDDRSVAGVRLRTGGRFHTGRLADTILALPRIVGLLRQHRPDYVCLLGWTSWLYVMARLRPFAGYKLVYICGLDSEIDGTFGRRHGWKGKLFERGVELSDVRYSMSDYQSELFRRKGLDFGFYRNLILPRSSPRTGAKTVDFLWVARCQPVKRPHLFLDFAERFPSSTCEMICPCEDAGLFDSVRSRAERIPNVVFRESVPYRDIQNRYDAAKLLVSTSEVEGFPNNMIQAAQGDAGILSLEVDPDGFIEKFHAGYFARGDFEALCQAAPSLLEKYADAARGARAMLGEWLDNDANTEAFLRYLSR